MRILSPTTRARKIAVVVIAAILFSQTAFLALAPRKAEASVPIHCSFIDLNCIKEFTLDTVLRAVVRGVYDQLVQQLLGWVTGGRGFNVGYLLNYEETLRDLLRRRQNEFLAGIRNLVPGPPRDIFFDAPRSLGQALLYDDYPNTPCDDFYYGSSLNSLDRVVLDPRQCNSTGFYMGGQEEQAEALSNVKVATDETQEANEGYLGERDPINSCDGTYCWTEYEAVTPGGLVKDAVSELELSDFDWLTDADEISELLVALASLAISQLISQAGGLF